MKLLLTFFTISLLLLFQNGYSLKFAAYGDTRTNPNSHKSVADAMNDDSPELVLHVGDLWDGYSKSQWQQIISGNSNLKALQDANKFLVARGNHESWSEVRSISPTVVRENSETYAFKEGNCFFLCLGFASTNWSWIRSQLESAESQSSDWRFIWMHKPVYSSGPHGANGNNSEGWDVSKLRELCDEFEVIMAFSGHDHFYLRTHLIFEGQTASQSTEVNITETPGTFYVVTGAAGPGFYNYSSAWFINAAEKIYSYCLIDAGSNQLVLKCKDTNGSTIDEVTITKNTGPYTTLNVPNGGEKWEQGSTYSISWSDNIDENVKIELYKGGSVNSTIASSTESDGTYEWQIPANQAIGNDYKIKISSIENDTVFSLSSANFSIEAEFILSVPYAQNFDDQDTGAALPEKWEQLSGDDFNWTVWTGPTPSKVGNTPDVTGPDGDHTSGNGNYLYVEASDPNNPSKKADFITPKFDIRSATNIKLTFWSHMYSSQNEMGDLYLDVEVDGAWNNDVVHLTDDHGDEWFETTKDLSSYSGDRMRLRFRAVTGASWASDICVDDLRVAGDIVTVNVNRNVVNKVNLLRLHRSRLCYTIPDNSPNISINLYDVKGKLVKTLVNGPVNKGTYLIDLKAPGNGTVSTGVYLCRMETAGINKTIKVIIKN